MNVYPTPQFKKSYKKVPTRIQVLAKKKDQIFRNDPFTVSLKTHRLKARLSSFWSYSVNYQYRIVFEFVGKDTVIYHDIGTHGIYK